MSNDYALFLLHLPNDFHSEETSTSADCNEAQINCRSSTNKSLCNCLKTYLSKLNNIDTIWSLIEKENVYQVIFYVEFGLISDRILQDLVKIGIGKRNDTKISVLPTTILLQGRTRDKNDSISFISSVASSNPSLSNESNTDDLPFSRKLRKRINESSFKKSVRARLMVHQVVANIRASTELSFDFVLLICLASMLAAFGLLESSTVVIVASMLVSPLMNPILGIVFGLSIREHSLWKRGLRNELIGLIICLSFGFLVGLLTTHAETKWGSSTSFPTSEMKSRGDIKRLWVGVLIALPSGAGVALSVLGGNTGSLVGVAISASLLPPAVNSGLLFAYSILARSFSDIGAIDSSSSIENKTFCPKLIGNDYLPIYTCHLAEEAAILAAASLLLTLVNIICIIIMALLILRIKEVVPLHQPNKEITDFFHHDVKVARDYNKTIQQESNVDASHFGVSFRRKQLTQSIISHWKKYTLSETRSDTTTSNVGVVTQNKTPRENLDETIVQLDSDSKQKLIRLRSFAKEYELDLFEKRHFDLIDQQSEEKVRLLVNDLIDVSEEMPNVSLDLSRLQPAITSTSNNDDDYRLFYRELIEALPPKWFNLYKEEEEKRRMPTKLKRQRSAPEYSIEGTRFRLRKLSSAGQVVETIERPLP